MTKFPENDKARVSAATKRDSIKKIAARKDANVGTI
jgi:hypothetical protein